MTRKKFVAAGILSLGLVLAGATAPANAAVSSMQAAPVAPVVITGDVVSYTPPPTPTKSDKATKGKPGLKGNPSTKASPPSTAFSACAPPCYYYNTGLQNVTIDGATVNLTIEKPFLDSANGDYHSLAELAVQATVGGLQQIVEVGWNVDPSVNGDSDPHLFVYRWVNGVGGTYNGSGWVDYAPTATNAGANIQALNSQSLTFGIQYSAGNWWVLFNGQWVGYFPATIWSGAGVTFTQGTKLQSFGEIASDRTETCSDMGRGTLGISGTASARVGSLSLINPVPAGTAPSFTGPSVTPAAATPGKFQAQQASGSVRTFNYGGPGWNAAGTAAGTTGSC